MKKLLFAIALVGIVSVNSVTLPSAQAAGAYANAVLADNPLGYYRMSETSGTIAFDSAGTPENGVYQGGVTLGVAGPRPSAFDGFEATNTGAKFDGVDDQLEITTLTTLNNTAYSYEVWLNYASNGGVQYFGGRGDGTTLSYDSVGVNNQTLLFFNGSVAVFDASVSPGTWHHLVYTRDNTDVNVYVDSVLRISTTSTITYGTSDRIVAGNRPGDSAPVNATLDELAIYDTALTAGQVTAHYAAAFVPEPSTVMLVSFGGLLLWRRARKQA